MEGFSASVRAAAEKLADPIQVGSWAWQVPSQGTPGKVRWVHTDARFADDGKAKLSFAACSCPSGAKTGVKVVQCSHVLRVLQTIRDTPEIPVGEDGTPV